MAHFVSIIVARKGDETMTKFTSDELKARATLEQDQIKRCQRIRITDQPINELDKEFWPSCRVFAIADDGTALELTTVTSVQWRIDATRRRQGAEAVIHFWNVEIDADATPLLPLELLPVEPKGYVHGIGCSHGNEGDGQMHCDAMEVPEYPRTAEADTLRLLRTVRRMSLEEARKLVGLSALDFSSLERGAKKLSKQQWTWVLERIAGSAQ